jgi:ubiquinone/menaquinone biosynthesis C-methylase UbiE
MSKGKFSLSLGCKETRFADINLDIDSSVNPDIVADARHLPFRDCVFQQVLFTDVIEHLPDGDEIKALQEIYRVLCNGGELVLTTPHNNVFYTFLDPAKYVIIHRHYKRKCVEDLLKNHGFQIEMTFIAGGLWTCLNTLWYCVITYPLKRIFNHHFSYIPLFMQIRQNQEYRVITPDGYTIFVRAKKMDANTFCKNASHTKVKK